MTTGCQLDLSLGQALKADGQERVEENNPSFVAVMRRHARELSARDGRVHCDQLRTYAANMGMVPAHPNAWGAIFKGKGWHPVGWHKSALPSNHARMVRVWCWNALEGE